MLAEYARAILVNCPIRPVDSQNQGGLKTMAKSRLRLIAPATEKRTVMPTRQPNTAYRTREHLTEREVTKLMKAAKANRWGQRDATMILVASASGSASWSTCAGIRSTSITPTCTSAGSRRARRATITESA